MKNIINLFVVRFNKNVNIKIFTYATNKEEDISRCFDDFIRFTNYTVVYK